MVDNLISILILIREVLNLLLSWILSITEIISVILSNLLSELYLNLKFVKISNTVLNSLILMIISCLIYYVVRNMGGTKAKQKLYKKCRTEIEKLIDKKNCHPIMLRLSWSDAATFDETVRSWPECGGCNGSIRFDQELDDKLNAGLAKAIAMLEPTKERYPTISWADLIQMAGAIAVEKAGGPKINMIYGRLDAKEGEKIFTNRAELPCPVAPFPDGAPSAEVHIRNIFYRMGFTNREIVALCGAHTLGRAFEDRTNVCKNSSGSQGATKYTRLNYIARGDKKTGIGIAGGCSWTKNWLQFDNSYFRRIYEDAHDPDLLWLPTDRALYECPEFRRYYEIYARNEEAFREDYAKAHVKMSSLGAKFGKNQSFQIDEE